MKNLYSILTILLISTSCFSQTPNTWLKVSDLGSDTTGNGLKRERAVAFSIDQFGYVGTGVDTSETVLVDFWKYDPTTNAWTQIADIPGSMRRNAISFTIDNYGYVGTGMDSVVASSPGAATLNDFWRYDPSNNSWSARANFPGNSGFGIYFSTGFSIDSKGYVCGGKMGPNNYSNQLWEYKPALDQWTQLANFPGGVRYQLCSFSIGYKAYVGLGTDQDMYRKDIWEFSAATNQWTQMNDFPASARASTMTFTLGQRGYVCMGTNGGFLDDLWEYNPFTDQWSSREPYGGTRRKGGVAFTINNSAYVGTGKGNSGKKASFQQYTPPAVVGINEIETHFTIYPNPVIDNIHIEINSFEIQKLELYSTYGRKVLSTPVTSLINTNNIASGIYILAAISKSGEIISKQKLIIQ